MTDPPATVNTSPEAVSEGTPRQLGGSFALRRPIPRWQAIALGITCVLLCLAVWWFITWGEQGEFRIVSPLILPSPAETFASLAEWDFREQLVRNTAVTLRRVILGFSAALLVGVPLGILAGCFPRVYAFLLPVVMFGRNIPIAALLPLMTFLVRFDLYYSSSEWRKVVFIFIATVSFVLADTARSIMEVAQRYVDTAYTLGASRWHTVSKVLVPLALPTIFSSARLMFGIAFGYIMLAEVVKEQDTAAGLGFQILMAQRRTYPEQVYLIIIIIPIVALVIDQFLFWAQRSLFPYQHASDGLLNHGVRTVLHGWDDLKRMVLGRSRRADEFLERYAAATVPATPPKESDAPAKDGAS